MDHKKVYPSWRYHKTLEPKIIHSESQEAEGWLGSPAFHEVEETKPAIQVETETKKATKPKAK